MEKNELISKCGIEGYERIECFKQSIMRDYERGAFKNRIIDCLRVCHYAPLFHDFMIFAYGYFMCFEILFSIIFEEIESLCKKIYAVEFKKYLDETYGPDPAL